MVAHHERPEAAKLAMRVAAWTEGRGGEAWLVGGDGEALALPGLESVRPASDADVVVSLGGDGTMLRTVELLAGSPVAVLGVNVGQLGYLTAVEPDELEHALDQWAAGRFVVEERMLLEVVVRAGPRLLALNEAVVEKREASHTVRLAVAISGSPFTTYVADGLIVATPTGSTAYSMSVRGPIVSPAHRAVLLTPVAPHLLFDRSLVLDPGEDVAITVRGHRPAQLSVDGHRAALLEEGDTVACRAAAETARFIRFGERHFHQILKAKFGLADR
jgi:NAD+ kinase